MLLLPWAACGCAVWASGALTEAYNPLGTTALMRGAEIGSRHLVRLLEGGAAPHATDTLGRSALFYAAKTGQDGKAKIKDQEVPIINGKIAVCVAGLILRLPMRAFLSFNLSHPL